MSVLLFLHVIVCVCVCREQHWTYD